MRVIPIETYQGLKDGFFILRQSGKIYLCQPVITNGRKASIAHLCQDAEEAMEMYERLRNEQV